MNSFAVQHARDLGCPAWEEDIQDVTHFQDGAFDIISACDVLEHCFAPEQALAEMYRILKTTGRVVVEIPFEAEFSQNLVHGHSVLFRDARHAETLFEEAGFCVEKRDLSCVSRNLFLLSKRCVEETSHPGAVSSAEFGASKGCGDPESGDVRTRRKPES